MKKSLIKVICALLLFTFIIALAQNNINKYTNWDDWIWTGEIKNIENIKNKKEVSLNSWLSLYSSWMYKRVEVVNWVDLKWYVFLDSTKNTNIRTLWKTDTIDNYYLVTAKKPSDTSITELWLNLTWDTPIKTIYNEDSLWLNLLKEFWWIILFMIIFIIWFRVMMGKWNWAGWLMDIKVWKKSTKETSKTRFSDVAWMDEVKNELMEVVDYLKNPEKYHKVWARHPKWILLYWEPGSWKTLLARAVAWEADVAFFSASWSEFMEMLVGLWAAKVRTLFKEAKEAGRAIIFIDEIDAIWKKRWNGTTW